MSTRSAIVAILLFCAACAPTTPEGTPFSANMTGLDGAPLPAAQPVEPAPTPTEDPEPEETANVDPPPAEPADAKPAKPETTDSDPPAVSTGSPIKPSKALAPDKTLPRKPGVQDLTFDDIAFEMEKGEPFARSMLPQEIEELSNQKIRIRGYILPSFESRGIKQFVLVRDNMECCFGPGAALYDCILVEMKGSGVDFTVRPVTVEGIFEIKEYLGPDGKHLAIYRMEGESAK